MKVYNDGWAGRKAGAEEVAGAVEKRIIYALAKWTKNDCPLIPASEKTAIEALKCGGQPLIRAQVTCGKPSTPIGAMDKKKYDRGQLWGVQSLDLNGCKLDTIPVEINQFPYLYSLDVQGNNLKTLPQLPHTQLKSLDLDQNKLTNFDQLSHSVPQSVEQLWARNNLIKVAKDQLEEFLLERNLKVFEVGNVGCYPVSKKVKGYACTAKDEEFKILRK